MTDFIGNMTNLFMLGEEVTELGDGTWRRDITKLAIAGFNIRGFFDNMDHDWLLKMLSLRIDDRAFLNLIHKWLKAGVLEIDGSITNPDTGTPQGGIEGTVHRRHRELRQLERRVDHRHRHEGQLETSAGSEEIKPIHH